MALLRAFFSALLCALAAVAFAGEQAPDAGAAATLDAPTNRWLIQTSVYTDHFSTDSQHTKHQNLIGLEWWAGNNWIMGAAAFRNSFDQASQYVYLGKLWRPWDDYPLVHLKLTAGILHGYKGEYKDKIPLNSESGYAPAILPSIGLSGKRFTTDLVLFGTAGAMVSIGDRKSTRLNSSHIQKSRMPSSA